MSRDDETTKLIWYYRHTQLARRRWTAESVGMCFRLTVDEHFQFKSFSITMLGEITDRSPEKYYAAGDKEL
jgi:hypothetical protein